MKSLFCSGGRFVPFAFLALLAPLPSVFAWDTLQPGHASASAVFAATWVVAFRALAEGWLLLAACDADEASAARRREISRIMGRLARLGAKIPPQFSGLFPRFDHHGSSRRGSATPAG